MGIEILERIGGLYSMVEDNWKGGGGPAVAAECELEKMRDESCSFSELVSKMDNGLRQPYSLLRGEAVSPDLNQLLLAF